MKNAYLPAARRRGLALMATTAVVASLTLVGAQQPAAPAAPAAPPPATAKPAVPAVPTLPPPARAIVP